MQFRAAIRFGRVKSTYFWNNKVRRVTSAVLNFYCLQCHSLVARVCEHAINYSRNHLKDLLYLFGKFKRAWNFGNILRELMLRLFAMILQLNKEACQVWTWDVNQHKTPVYCIVVENASGVKGHLTLAPSTSPVPNNRGPRRDPRAAGPQAR